MPYFTLLNCPKVTEVPYTTLPKGPKVTKVPYTTLRKCPEGTKVPYFRLPKCPSISLSLSLSLSLTHTGWSGTHLKLASLRIFRLTRSRGFSKNRRGELWFLILPYFISEFPGCTILKHLIHTTFTELEKILTGSRVVVCGLRSSFVTWAYSQS